MESASDAALVERIRGGDQQAWNQLIDRHGGRVWTVARSQGLDRERASDVVQTVWLNLLHGIDRIRQPDAIVAWLTTSARREAIRVDRMSKRALLVGDERFDREPATGAALDDGAVARQDGAIVRQAIEQLGGRCAELLRLLYSNDELSYQEIGELLDMPVGSIGPTRARCLDRLRVLATAGGLTR
jgi:RNA polymerase sigma factor (sigma-70 family)